MSEHEVEAAVWDVLAETISDHAMWIGDDGEPLDYLPEREARLSEFVHEAADALAPLIAERERVAAERAWSEGYEAGSDDEANARYDLGSNPYRAALSAPQPADAPEGHGDADEAGEGNCGCCGHPRGDECGGDSCSCAVRFEAIQRAEDREANR